VKEVLVWLRLGWKGVEKQGMWLRAPVASYGKLKSRDETLSQS
jgi:hypothetical protein